MAVRLTAAATMVTQRPLLARTLMTKIVPPAWKIIAKGIPGTVLPDDAPKASKNKENTDKKYGPSPRTPPIPPPPKRPRPTAALSPPQHPDDADEYYSHRARTATNLDLAVPKARAGYPSQESQPSSSASSASCKVKPKSHAWHRARTATRSSAYQTEGHNLDQQEAPDCPMLDEFTNTSRQGSDASQEAGLESQEYFDCDEEA